MSSKNGTPQIEAEHSMAGVLAILVADREERLSGSNPRKTEVVLADAGLSHGEIAAVTGKQYGAVKMAIQRSRKPTKKKAK